MIGVKFKGTTGSYIDFGRSSDYNLQNFTLVFEIFVPSAVSPEGTIFFCNSVKWGFSNQRSGYYMALSSNSVPQFAFLTASNAGDVDYGHYATSPDSIPTDRPVSVIATLTNGRKGRIYVDGVLKGESITTTEAVQYTSSGGATAMGLVWEEISIKNMPYPGIIGYARLYNRVLSDAEILQAKNGTRLMDGLVAEWMLDEGSGTTAYDTFGTRDGTIVNADWVIYEEPVPDEIIPNYPPASKIQLRFKAGDSDPLPMGIYYVDRMQFEVGQGSASVDARNSIGKYLKDQTFDERNIYTPTTVQALLTQILTGAGITNYHVGAETTELGMEFSPSQDIMSGINDVLTTVRDWQIREEIADGKVVVAERTDAAFTQLGKYTFYRSKDVFSRSVTKDDGQTYGRVCVHTSDFAVKVYRPVSSSLGWLPPAQKTLYQQAPDGTTPMAAAALATEIAEQLSNSGEVEEFVGPIRPQLMPGDQAEIIDDDGPRLVGVITTVTHGFGLDGFYTSFTVDSGGKINKPQLSDYLRQISAGTVKSKITS